MGFVLSKVFWAIAAPGNLLVLMLVVGTLRLGGRRRRRGFRLVATATIALLAIALLPIGQWLAMPLESRFPAPELPQRVDGIVVLGGAVVPAISRAHGQVALNDAGERLVEALTLARRYPDAQVLVSGGDAALLPRDEPSEAAVMRDLLVEQGIDPARIRLEERSRNTVENAVFSREIAQPAPGQVWLLVTTATHMPRAVGCFRHIGWQVVPYPVDYRSEASPRPGFLLSEHLALVDVVVKEWIGLLAYRILGHTDEIFPAP
ncbi:MAG TPA: YdcF family protein [Stellaceae bacterium]|nr:YdcF family protein [Stellaceae bacterium]